MTTTTSEARRIREARRIAISNKRARGRLAQIERAYHEYHGGEWPYGGDGIHEIMLATILAQVRAIKEGPPATTPPDRW